MPSTATILTFALAATLLIIIPGPNVLFIVSRGIDQGRAAAIASSLGVETGMFVHIAAAMLGLSAVVTSSEILFNTVKYAGVAYLLWLGLSAIRSGPVNAEIPIGFRRAPLRRLYMQGMIVNVLNPKVGLFMLAFLPQFVDPSRGSAQSQILVLGMIFVAIACVSDGLYAIGSGAIGHWLARHAAAARQRGRFSGVVYILLGALAAFSGSHAAGKT
jgi:threonine/homoserine/homoserine lactone efflux protein